MGLTRTKTYAVKTLFVTGSWTAANINKELFYEIKESLLYGTDGIKGGTNAWTVMGSSDSSTAGMDTTDRWTDYTKVVNSATNRSWIVLKNANLGSAPNYFQVCIDVNSGTSGIATVVMSTGAGFSGGAISARPTATDEQVLTTGTDILSGSTAVGSAGVNCLKSTDGKVTRVFPSKDGALVSKPFWLFEELNNVESYWTSKAVGCVCGATLTALSGTSNVGVYNGSACSGRMTFLATDTASLVSGSTAVRTNVPDIGGDWTVFPVGMLVDTGTSKGRIGDFYDLWAAPIAVPLTTYFAGSAGGSFQYVTVAPLVFPWVGTRLVLP